MIEDVVDTMPSVVAEDDSGSVLLSSLWAAMLLLLVLVAGGLAVRKLPRRPVVASDRPGVVVLHQIGRGPRAPSVSPFPLKLETYLRMAGIPYENDHKGGMSSKGKTPWITFEGQDVADSQFSIDFLNDKFNVDLSSHLDHHDRAVARAFQKMTEEDLYWSMCGWAFGAGRSRLASLLPYKGLTLWLVVAVLGRTVRKQLWAQGMGRHSPAQMTSIGRQDLEALSAFIGDKPFLVGCQPCEADCSIFGILAQIKWHMPGSPHQNILTELANLNEYCERMKERYWPDWGKCLLCTQTEKE